MALFTDTVTIYNKVSDSEWKRIVVKGVQWSDRHERKNADGVVSVARYVSVTFPRGTYEGLEIVPDEENCIVYGEVADAVTGERGSRISDLRERYPRSGIIKAVSDNSGRTHLKNIKAVLV